MPVFSSKINLPALNVELLCFKQSNRLGVKFMLNFLYFFPQGLRCFCIRNFYRFLTYYRTMVVNLIDNMNRCTADLAAGFEHGFMNLHTIHPGPREKWQQCRV